jgi:hypothetical protein
MQLTKQTDPGQIHNLHPSVNPSYPTTLDLTRLLPRLDALLMVTKSCKGSTCIHPWSVIHPAGNVKTLGDALNGRFDSYYASVAEVVSFDKCELGYIIESEGPQRVRSFEEWIAENEQQSREEKNGDGREEL